MILILSRHSAPCTLQENLLCSNSVVGSLFSDYVAYKGDLASL